MPELPDIEVYLDAPRKRTLVNSLERTEVLNPFVLRSVAPPLPLLEGHRVRGLRRVGKRVVFEFDSGKLVLTEAGTKRRAFLHLIQGEDALNRMDAGGLDTLTIDLETFKTQLQRENHTLKRALTDPKLFSGIGNAYSDEILHAAKLSPIALTRDLSAEHMMRLLAAIQKTLTHWTQRLLKEAGEGFPQKVTAFREGMGVHGRYGKPCPACASPVQRIVYAGNETHYCARCQTGGKILADRALSRLLKKSWPRNIEDV
jgi:formamidopyrimidine-DNA glycosylase